MDLFIKISQFLLSITLLVFLHELGHFIPAKLFKCRVEKFYVFFDFLFPLSKVFPFSLFKIKRGETTYGIGWFPFGGYVKIAGIMDESMDKETMSKPPQPWEFRAKPAWQRLIIMLGGVFVNVVVAMLIYWMILFVWGETFLPTKNLKDGLWIQNEKLLEVGYQNGDNILEINNEKVTTFSSLDEQFKLSDGGFALVQRGDSTLKLPIPRMKDLNLDSVPLLFIYRMPFYINSIADSSINKNSGLQEKDQLIALDGRECLYFDQAKAILQTVKGQEIIAKIKRDDEVKELTVKVDDNGRLNVFFAFTTLKQLEKLGVYELDVKEYGFFEALPRSIGKAVEKIKSSARQFALIANPETGAYKQVRSMVYIAKIFPPTWEWHFFWEITAIISISLAFMNVLPIPALDGGHALFIIYELVTGRKPSDKFLEYAQMIGMLILITLIFTLVGRDIFDLSTS